MYITICLNICAVLFAYLAKYKEIKSGLKISFLLILVFSALRFNFGNDYHTYLDVFEYINNKNRIVLDVSHYEIGWITLCKLFKPFGFFVMVACLAIFNCIVYYRFIKKYINVEYYWLAVFIYVFDPQLMLIQLSAMRQTFAIGLFIIAVDFIITKKALAYFGIISFASFFHESAIIFLPLYFINYINITNTVAFVFLGIFCLLFILGNMLSPLLINFISKNFDRYSGYLKPSSINSGFGIMIFTFYFALVLFSERYQTYVHKIFFKLSIIGYLLIPMGLIIMMFGRLLFYFQALNLVIFPYILFSIRKSHLKIWFLGTIIFFTLFNFFAFFNSEIWSKSFGVYKTIFSAPHFY